MYRFLFTFAFIFSLGVTNAQDSTYADKLGFPKGAKVLILHIDDVGMSYDQNAGTIEVLEKGAARSCSIMMPCPWVAGFFHYLKDHPEVDAGLHLTLTSEWKDYRWHPLSGKPAVPGLVDKEGAMWPSVEEVVKHASADEVDREIRAQLQRSLDFGFRPTHMDSHMGTLFATPAFIQKYVQLGMEYKIPVMMPGGHGSLVIRDMKLDANTIGMMRAIGRRLWDAGLPVIDDLHNTSYAPHLPAGIKPTRENLKKYKTQFYIDALKELKPGITYMIMHCIKPTEVFKYISDSQPEREGDYEAMMNPEFRKALEKEGIIVTTMRELSVRRAGR
jgi:chitin disaccharide deacetylase